MKGLQMNMDKNRHKIKNRYILTIIFFAILLFITVIPGKCYSTEVDDETLQKIKLQLQITSVSNSALKALLESNVEILPDIVPGTTALQAALDGMTLGYILDDVYNKEYQSALGKTISWAVKNRYLWTALGMPYVSTGIAIVDIGVGFGVFLLDELNEAVTNGKIKLYCSFRSGGDSDTDAWDIIKDTYGWPNVLGKTTEEIIEDVHQLAIQAWELQSNQSSTRTNLATLGQKIAEMTGSLASFSASPTSGKVPLTVSFDASSSKPSEGQTIVSYAWSFGNGNSGTGITTSYVYNFTGNYTATLTVTDSANLTSSATKTIYDFVD